MQVTRRSIAEHVFRHIPDHALRVQFRKSRDWAALFPGFRPDRVTRALYLQRAASFATDVSLLRSLCTAYLDDLGVATGESLEQRFGIAALVDSLGPTMRELFTELSVRPLSDFPAFATNGHQSNGATADVASEGSAREPHPSSADVHPDDVSAHIVASPTTLLPAEMHSSAERTYRRPMEPRPLEWTPPQDDVTELQQAVTLFERALAAFVGRQLQELHGLDWHVYACPEEMLKRWRDKVGRNRAAPPASLLGYAELGDLFSLMTRPRNWDAFASYFTDVDAAVLQQHAQPIIAARVNGMHASQRELKLVEQVAALDAMIKVAKTFHDGAASQINALFESKIAPPESVAEPTPAGHLIESNLGDFPPPRLVGRHQELQTLRDFWQDPYATKLSIHGAGGVGKSALLDTFIHELLSRPVPAGSRPDPEAIIYLTAKDNYLADMEHAPDARRFRTLHRIYEVTLSVVAGEVPPHKTTAELREPVLSLAKEARVLFALDNLESLDEAEYEQIGMLLDELPSRSKAILTTRVDRRMGRGIELHGLESSDARDLLQSKISGFGITIRPESEADVQELVKYTDGFPLSIIYVANAVGNGKTLREAIDAIKGKSFQELLMFSFESSVALLEERQLQVLLFLCLSKTARTRTELLNFVVDEPELDACLTDLSLRR